MPLGPVELVVLSFPGEHAGPDVGAAPVDVVDENVIRRGTPRLSGDDMVSRLTELAKPKDAGILSEEEFSAKAKVLAG